MASFSHAFYSPDPNSLWSASAHCNSVVGQSRRVFNFNFNNESFWLVSPRVPFLLLFRCTTVLIFNTAIAVTRMEPLLALRNRWALDSVVPLAVISGVFL